MWNEESCGSFCGYALIFGFGRLWKILKDRNSKWKARTCTNLSRRLLLARYDQILCDFGRWYAGVGGIGNISFLAFWVWKTILLITSKYFTKIILLCIVYFLNNIPSREEHYMNVFCIFLLFYYFDKLWRK